MAQRGLVIDHVVSGDAGCSDPVLIPTAIGLDASGLGQTKPVRLYLYVFRTSEVFERLRTTVDACAREGAGDVSIAVLCQRKRGYAFGLGRHRPSATMRSMAPRARSAMSRGTVMW